MKHRQKTNKRTNETKSLFFDVINKIEKHLVDKPVKTERRDLINKTRDSSKMLQQVLMKFRGP